MTPAEEVAERRHQLGMSQREFGVALGLSPTAAYDQVRKWEAGKGAPSAAAMTAMRLLVRVAELEAEIAKR